MSTAEQHEDDDLLTVDYVAKKFNVSDKTVRRWIREKHLACELVGPAKRIRIKRSELTKMRKGGAAA